MERLAPVWVRTGEEFRRAWSLLRQEAVQSSDYLGKELEGPLAADVEGAGEGSTDGSTRRKVTGWLEESRSAVLTKALQEYPDQQARPVWVYPQFDKLSFSWLQSLPGPTPSGLTPVEFMEAVAQRLCLPSPSCSTRLGENIGWRNLTVDQFGDNVMSDVLPGDHLRIRHDRIKTVINSLCLVSKVRTECEVYGQFSDLIPVKARETEQNLQYGRGRAGLIPDFKILLPSQTGGTEPVLAELKVIGAARTWYPRSGRSGEKGVERRANRLTGEYTRPLARLDQTYHNTPPGQVGPLVRRLQTFGRLRGLVVGAWGEGSKDLHGLLDVLADSRLRTVGMARGREGSDAERGVILGQFRRVLSCEAVRAQTQALVGRLQVLGDKGRQASRRREAVIREDRRLELEQRAYWQAYIRGTGAHRGTFVVPT